MHLNSATHEDFKTEKITKICKSILSKSQIPFNSLDTDFNDGAKLLKFIEIVGNIKINQAYNEKPKFRIHKLQNISIALQVLNENCISTKNINAENILNGEIEPIKYLISEIIRKFQYPVDIEDEDDSKKDNSLLNWCQKNKFQCRSSIEINDFGKTWETGYPFCLLIHNNFKNIIDFQSLSEQTVEKNWQQFFDACNKIGIPLLFQTRYTISQSPELIEKQVKEMYFFINYDNLIRELDESLIILEKLSKFPLNYSLSQSFSATYQKNIGLVHDLHQKYVNRDPKIEKKDIQMCQTRLKNEIIEEIEQLKVYISDYIKSVDVSLTSDQSQYSSIKNNFEVFIGQHKNYFLTMDNLIKSITIKLNETASAIWDVKAEERKKEEKLNEYISSFNQTSNYFTTLQNIFNNLYGNYNNNDLNSILEEAQNRINMIKSKHNELKLFKIEINEFQYGPYIIQNKYQPLIQSINNELDIIKQNEQKASQYISFADTKLNDLNDFTQQFNQNKYNRSTLDSIFSNVSNYIPKLICIKERYDELGKVKSLIISKYHPESIISEFSSLSNKIHERIAFLDSEQVGVSVLALIPFYQALNNNNQAPKIAKHVHNLPPLTYNTYPPDMMEIQYNHWENKSKYDSPLFSDLHEPIRCDNEQEMNSILHNIYFNSQDSNLGGERVVYVYSQMVSAALHESSLTIRCIHDLGFQRNQDINSLFIHVKTQNIKILEMCYNPKKHGMFFYMKIKNISNKRIYFCLQKGTVIDLPINQQPLYIAQTWSGYIESNQVIEKNLMWYCMKQEASPPVGDAKLTPFIIAAPERYFNNNEPYNPDNENFWALVQPYNTKKNTIHLSNSNFLWERTQKETKIREIIEKTYFGENPEWDYEPIQIGGIVDNDLFQILNEKRNSFVTSIIGVVRNLHWSNCDDANNAMIITNQMGIVITIQYCSEQILIEKTESGKWEGGYCRYNSYNETYTYNGFSYYKDFSSISKSYFHVGRIINGMRSDPKYYNAVSYNSQSSRQYLFGTLGISIPTIHNAQILIPSLHTLVNYS